MAQMFQANPHMQQMMEQMASNPAALSAALNNPFARSMMGAGVEGMGAGTAAAAPPRLSLRLRACPRMRCLRRRFGAPCRRTVGVAAKRGNQAPSQP